MRDSEFDWMGAFGYSDQEGAGAFSEEKKLPEREIERRRKHLMQIQRKISKRKKKALVGKEFDLVLEGISEESDLLLEGRTPMHAPEIDGKVFVNDVPEGHRTEDGRVLSLPDHRSPRLRSGRQDRVGSQHGSQAHLKLKCPICKKPVNQQGRRVPFLQRSLPPD